MKKEWLIAGAVVGCIAGGSLGACSSGGGAGGTLGSGGSTATTTSTTGSSTTASSTTTTTTSGGGTSSTTMTTTSGGGNPTTTTTTSSTGAGGGTTCKTPTTLHPPHLDAGPGTIYCPFSAVDGGKNEYCTPQTEHCCETPAGSTIPSACLPMGTTCNPAPGPPPNGSTDWQCEDPVTDCQQGEVCCAPGATIGLGGTVGGMQCANFAHHMTYTACLPAAQCPNAGNMGNIILCTSDSECPSATPTCTPFGKAGNQVGGCM
jgi:hypothetical protein